MMTTKMMTTTKTTMTMRLLTISAAVIACGAACTGGAGGPVPAIANLTYDGPAPDSPLVLLLSVDFTDDDGDLSGGVLDTFINQRPTSAGPLQLLPIFIESHLDAHATSGTLDFVLELSFGDDPPASGSTFTLGARATDGADNTSGTQEIKLRLEGDTT
jgi:hypothetical protein